jgi:hypothetical protein
VAFPSKFDAGENVNFNEVALWFSMPLGMLPWLAGGADLIVQSEKLSLGDPDKLPSRKIVKG